MKDSASEQTGSGSQASDTHKEVPHRDNIGITDNVETVVRDAKTGEIIKVIRTHNLLVTQGKAIVANQIGAATRGNITQVAVGDDDTEEALTDTALGNQTFIGQVTQYVDGGGGEVIVRLFIGAASNNGNTIKEGGVLTEDGELVARWTYDPPDQVAKTEDITTQINWTLDIG